MTPALAHDHSPGDPLLLLKPRAPGVTIKTFGAPGPVARITVIR
jgi:hypothetical protein